MFPDMVRSRLLADLPHAFTGRADGDLRPGAAGQIEASERLRVALGGRTLHTVSQVHGATVHAVDGEAAAGATGGVEADAMWTAEPGRLLAIRVADCVPVLLAAPGGVAAVHAGWRGTAADIVRRSVEALCEGTGAEAGALRAAVGPAICGECYEVGDEVLAGVAAVAVGEGWRPAARHVDLRRANADILASLGVRVELVGGCTRCSEGWWSHRRDGAAAGRQAGIIGR